MCIYITYRYFSSLVMHSCIKIRHVPVITNCCGFLILLFFNSCKKYTYTYISTWTYRLWCKLWPLGDWKRWKAIKVIITDLEDLCFLRHILWKHKLYEILSFNLGELWLFLWILEKKNKFELSVVTLVSTIQFSTYIWSQKKLLFH